MIVRLIVSLPDDPPESVTSAVMVWLPTLSVDEFTEAPVPSEPSRLDDQAMFAEMSPSSVSVAVPVKVTSVFSCTLVPLAGEVMDTTGAVFTFPVPWMSNVKGLSSGSSFAIDTVADRSPDADGVNVIEKVV